MLRNDNFTSSFRAKKSILHDVLKYSSSSGGCNIQAIFEVNFFFKKKLGSDLHHKFEKHII